MRHAGVVLFLLSLQAVLFGAAAPEGGFVLLQAAVNPLAGRRFYVDPNSAAQRQAETLRRSRPQDAELLSQIASRPVARWMGGWVGNIAREVDAAASTITRAGAMPIFVAYNIPGRDCGLYSAGGANGSDAYRRWIRAFADGLRGRQAVVILEPDALSGIDCLNPALQQERLVLLSEAVAVLKAQKAMVYVDAGNARWRSADQMAARLRQVNVAAADGFSLNVSNYLPDSVNIAYGERLSRLLGGKHFIIDTSRNGLGTANDWCNPRGQALGVAPTTNTGHPLVDAFLWVKQPGESDGTCAGGPNAGSWWTEIALELSRAASTLSRTIVK
ncbi:MAG: Glucanase [Gemmatimonadetes bacterium]|jgi:endoglucanase|nr:Glucanase [Gemmatimonadota bacterium]